MAEKTLLVWLIERYPLAKRTTFRRMLADRRVRVNGVIVGRLNQGISDSDRIEVGERREHKSRKPGCIIHEDADLVVVNKPAGLLTSTGPREKRRTLLEMLREYLAESEPRARLGLIHRLDRDASGLLVLSKTDAAYRSLKSQFFHHTVVRQYVAVVHGKPNPAAGRIESRLVERADGTVHSTELHAKGQRAITDYQTIRSEVGLSLVRLTLLTGRKHQIRVHLSERGNPIIGDATYGVEDDDVKGLMLAAVRLAFQHPRTGEKVEFELPVPNEFVMRP
jgi:23S rRNA pseudouridine1911/1915/1917 synthase